MAILDDIRQKLIDAGVVEGSSAFKISLSWMPPTPDKIITVIETGGEGPDLTQGTPVYVEPTFQILGRGEAFGYSELRTKMKEAFNTLNKATLSQYVYIFGSQSAPINLGYDTNNRPELSWNFRVLKEDN